MTSKRVYVDHLKNVPLFSGLARKQLERVAIAGQELLVKDKTVVMEQGTRGREAYLIIEGVLQVRRNGRKVATLGPGAIVGELSLFDSAGRSATVIAIADCRLFVLNAADFRAVMADVPEVSHRVLASLAYRIRGLEKSVLD
ncbi:MAG: cyclic nucleotide-binding domain-containing protein [Actinomycetota bacterium]